jgi:two-component system cell cycle response regulator
MESDAELDFEGENRTQQVTTMPLPDDQEAGSVARELPYLIVLGGTSAGEMFRIDAGTTLIGRGESAHVRIVDEDVSREHAQLVVQGGRAFIQDLGSKNGTFLNGIPIAGRRVLRDGDKVAVGSTTVLKFTYHDRIEEELQQRLYERARRDTLTGLFNRKYFDEQLRREFAYARRHARPLTLILFDVDHFKKVNDSYGHLTGDLALTGLANRIRPVLRDEDLFARYGGEEFVLLCRSTDVEQATLAAERLREAMSTAPFRLGEYSLRITMSAGVAMFPDAGIGSPEALIAAADQALYCAKHGGRNQVVVHKPGDGVGLVARPSALERTR